MITARLTDIELVGTLEKKRGHFVLVHIDDEVAAKFEKRYGVSGLRWQEEHIIKFRPSSSICLSLFRQSLYSFHRPHKIGQYTCNVGKLLANSTPLDLMDQAGRILSAGLIVKLSIIADPAEDIMRSVDADLAQLKDNDMLASTSDNIDDAIAVYQTGVKSVKSLGSCITPLGQALQLFVKVMDSVADAHPILKVSWTVISAVYKTVKAQMLQDDAVLGLAEALREMVGVAAEFPELRVIKGTTDVIEEIGRASLQVASLIDEYTRLKFVGRMLKFQITGDMKRRIDQCEKDCRDLVEKFDRRVRIDTNKAVSKLGAAVQEGFKTIKDEALAQRIFAWLSAPDSSRNYNDARKKNTEGTCSWVINGEEFSGWKKDRDSFLCFYGKPGCGKTVLCSSIITRVADDCKKQEASAYAYFFFDARDAQSALQRHDGLIRSLILQFADQCGGIPAPLAQLYGNGHQQPPTDALEDTLQRILCGIADAYIMIDSLDECAERWELLNWIEKIVLSKTGTLHLLITSRPEEDIMDSIKSSGPAFVLMDEKSVNGDIDTYIDLKMKEGWLKKWPDELRSHIKEELRAGAHGMFHWASLQLKALETCVNRHEPQQQLERLPKDLDETYHRILVNIDEQRRRDATIFLQWVAFSARPLTIEELVETAAFDFDWEDGPRYNPDRVYPVKEDVLTTCSNLIIKSEATPESDSEKNLWGYWDKSSINKATTVKLSHFSVKQYLLSDRIRNGPAGYFGIGEKLSHSLISQTCLAYLLRLESLAPLSDEKLIGFPLAPYAAEHWIFHVRLGGTEGESVEQNLILILLKSEGPLTNWIRLWDPYEPWEDRKPDLQPTEIADPLVYTSLLGITAASRHLLEDGASLEARGGDDINVQIRWDDSPLRAACQGGHLELAKMLLQYGADVNSKGLGNDTALRAASAGGHLELTLELLKHGADINAKGLGNDTPLRAASDCGHLKLTRVLLEHSADVNAMGWAKMTALHAACDGGYVEIATMLLEHGADANARRWDNSTDLCVVSLGGHLELAKQLLKYGADVNAKGRGGETALRAAAAGGHLEIVKVLLEHGADIRAKGDLDDTALRAASFRGHLEIAKVLLERGAEVNAKGWLNDTPLHAASVGGYLELAELLLEHEADVNGMGEADQTALRAASDGGHLALQTVLLAHGATPLSGS